LQLEDAARQYRVMTLLELARESLGNAGVNTRGLSRDEVATRALHSSSDFPEILSAITNKTLRQAYEAYPRTFPLFCRQVLATDFKAHAPAHPVAASRQALTPQMPPHLPRAIKRVFEKALINLAHQGKIGCALAPGWVINTGPAQGVELALNRNNLLRHHI